MKILLVDVPYTDYIYKTREALFLDLPLGLAYLAAYLRQEGISVEVLDANAEKLSVAETAEQVRASSAEVVGISTVTLMMPRVYEVIQEIKNRSDKIIILGGHHVSFLPQQTFEECGAVDIIVKGEGEETLADLLKNMGQLSEVKGISYRQDGKVYHNGPRQLIRDINTIPFPARDLFPVERYFPDPMFSLGVKGAQYAKMVTSRGCTDKCVYCASPNFWEILRFRRPENILAEIEYLRERYNVKHIFFIDDTISASRQRIIKLCDMIMERKLDIYWNCYARADHLTPEVVGKMKQAGCFGMEIGVESGNQEIIDRVQRRMSLAQVRTAIKAVKKAGIKVSCFFMIGLPGDTEETVEQTIRFAKELKPDLAYFSVTIPFPGTQLYDKGLGEGVIQKNHDWEMMSTQMATVYHNESLTADQVKRLYAKAVRSFYFRPSYFFLALYRCLRYPYEIRNYLNLFMGFISKVRASRSIHTRLAHAKQQER